MPSRVLLLMVLAGCHDSTVHPDAPTPIDARSIDAVSIDAPICNTIASQSTTTVVEHAVATAPPDPVGGELLDGTYTQSDSIVYTGVGGMTGPTGATIVDATSVLHGGSYDYVDTGSPEYRAHGTYATSNVSDIVVTQTCPMAGPLGYTKYDATPTSLAIYDYTVNFGAVTRVTSYIRIGP